MEKYEELELRIVQFKNEDVIVTSGGDTDTGFTDVTSQP